MSNWIRLAETIRINDLSISRDDPHGAYVIYAPWDPNLYVTDIAGNKIGYAPRYILKRSLIKLEETYPEGVPKELILTEPVQKVDVPLVMRLGSYILDKVRKERKKWLPYEPEPRGWEDGSGTTTEKAYKAINRPEENFESSSL